MSYFIHDTARVTGDLIVNGVYIPYQRMFLLTDEQLAAFSITKHADPEPTNFDPVPNIISDRQFFQALAMEEIITQQEALDAVKTGSIPAALQAMIAGLTGADAFAAEMLLSGATQFDIRHALTQQIATARGMNSDQLATFWRFASSL